MNSQPYRIYCQNDYLISISTDFKDIRCADTYCLQYIWNNYLLTKLYVQYGFLAKKFWGEQIKKLKFHDNLYMQYIQIILWILLFYSFVSGNGTLAFDLENKNDRFFNSYHLDGHFLAGGLVLRPVHLGEAALPELLVHIVVLNTLLLIWWHWSLSIGWGDKRTKHRFVYKYINTMIVSICWVKIRNKNKSNR